MALIRYSPLINNIRGSVGNATFQRSQGGNIIRNKPVLVYRSSPYTEAVRAAMASCEFAWRGLSAAQQQQYTNFLNYSPDFQWYSPKQMISGYSLFLKYNCLRLLNGLSILTSFVYNQSTFYPHIDSFFVVSPYFYIVFNASVDTDEWTFSLRASAGLSSTKTVRINALRIIPHGTGDSNTFDLASAYTSIYGAVPSKNQYVGYDLTFFSNTMPFVFSSLKGIMQVSGV